MNPRVNNLQPDSTVVHIGVGHDPVYGSVTTPIYQTVTYQHPGEELGEYDYSRTKNPTRSSLAQGLNRLENGGGATIFSSGMAAITALFHTLNTGDHLIMTNDVYGGSYRLLVDIFDRFGVTFSFADTRDLNAVKSQITEKTRLIFIETPSNPLMQISSIQEIADLAHNHNALLAVDNTFMTALRQRPLEWGADFSVYSATKYLSGHNDVLAGAIVARDPQWAQTFDTISNTTGGVLAPFDAWLVMRGLKTLAIRLDRQETNASSIAEFLQHHPQVSHVYYPSLPTNPGQSLHYRQASGSGAMLSFQLKDPDNMVSFMNNLGLILPAVSLGGCESLVTHPFTETHREYPEHIRYQLGITPGLIRLSVGIENVQDLISDLDHALESKGVHQ